MILRIFSVLFGLLLFAACMTFMVSMNPWIYSVGGDWATLSFSFLMGSLGGFLGVGTAIAGWDR